MFHPHLLHTDNTVIVVVDMQEPFLRVIHDRERVVKNVVKLVQGAAVLAVPIVSTVQNLKSLGDVVPEIKQLLPIKPPPFEKMRFSCYADVAIASALDRIGRKQVILCGVESHICISLTALGLIHAGFQVHICEDAVSSRTEENWKLGIKKVQQAGGLINCTESVLFEMLGKAGTAEFRAILQIVK